MEFDKPCRIVNSPSDIWPVPHCFCPGLKENATSYELDIKLPDHGMEICTVSIRDGRLYLEAPEPANDHAAIVCLLPADVWQERVEAFRMPFGIRVVMLKQAPGHHVIQVGVI